MLLMIYFKISCIKTRYEDFKYSKTVFKNYENMQSRLTLEKTCYYSLQYKIVAKIFNISLNIQIYFLNAPIKTCLPDNKGRSLKIKTHNSNFTGQVLLIFAQKYI